MKFYRVLSFAFAALFLCFASGASAQMGASSASLSRSRAISNNQSNNAGSQNSNYYNGNNAAASFAPPDAVAVEEFVNYHRHRLPLPRAGQSVAMETRWGGDGVSDAQREAVLQIGFTTAEVTERTDLRPLNLALVIDRSGSMADDDKMPRVKESLRLMLGKLRADDIVSMVVFDTDAQVLFAANRVGDGNALRRAIDCIEPGGSTNLNAGLMLGYREAQKNYRKDATNRVILLTDGIANVGVTDPRRIAAASSEFNGQGIDLSTVGVGLELNNDLLRTLATSGRGLYHFVSDYADIEKVFVDEVQSLVSAVAKKVEVNVDYDSNLEVEKIYGYAPRTRANGVSIALDNMNNGLTEVVLMRFRAKNAAARNSAVKVRLSYFDVKQKRAVEQVQEINLNAAEGRNAGGLLTDVEVKKNFTIAELAQSLFDMREAVKANRFREGENFLNASVAETFRRYPSGEDKDVQYVLNIVENYRRDLQNYNRQTSRGDGDCGSCR